MNKAEQQRLRKVLEQLERKSGRKGKAGKFSTSPIVFGVGLGLADFLLLDFVPKAWATLLPGGLEQAATIQGQAESVLRLAILANEFRALIPMAIIGLSVTLLILCWVSKLARMASWLAAFGVIMLNIWIVVTVLRTSWSVNAEAAGIIL